MQIETIIAKIAAYQYDKTKDVPDDILDAVRTLIARMEGMFPKVRTANEVSAKLEIVWSGTTKEPLLAWAWTVWPLFHANRIAEFLPVVKPMLPAGEPYGDSEMFSADNDLALAVLSGDKQAEEVARTKKAEMAGRNLTVGGGAAMTPDPVRVVGKRRGRAA